MERMECDMEIKVGMEYTAKTVVDKSNTASAVGSGLLEVFATPMMIALMELAAAGCIQGELEEGQASVGTKIEVAHTSATPVGMEVYATARVTGVDRRRVDFEVSARDGAGKIGSGTHTRFVVDAAPFLEKAQNKAKEDGHR